MNSIFDSNVILTAKFPPLRKECVLANQTLYENSFGVRGPRMWNCIPADIKAIKSMDTFKSKMTQLMLSVPDTPPIRGYTPINSNSLLEWRNTRDASALWGGRRILWSPESRKSNSKVSKVRSPFNKFGKVKIIGGVNFVIIGGYKIKPIPPVSAPLPLTRIMTP